MTIDDLAANHDDETTFYPPPPGRKRTAAVAALDEVDDNIDEEYKPPTSMRFINKAFDNETIVPVLEKTDDGQVIVTVAFSTSLSDSRNYMREIFKPALIEKLEKQIKSLSKVKTR